MKKTSIILLAIVSAAFTAFAELPAPIIDLKCNASEFELLQDNSASKCQVTPVNKELMEWLDGPAGKTIAFKDENIEVRQKRAGIGIRLPENFDLAKGFTFLINFKTNANYQYKKRYQLLHFGRGADKITGMSLFIYWRSIKLRYGTESRTDISSNGTAMPIRPDTWYELALTYDGKQAAIYINGKLEAKADEAVIPVPQMRNPSISVGCTTSNGAGYGFAGIISKVQLYDRAFTADEIADLD